MLHVIIKTRSPQLYFQTDNIMQGITMNRKAVFKYGLCPLLLAALDAFYCHGAFTIIILTLVIPVGIVLIVIYLFMEWIDAVRNGDVRKKTTRQIVLLLPFVVFGLMFQIPIHFYVKQEFTEIAAVLLEHKRAFGIPEKLSDVPQITQRWEVENGKGFYREYIEILGRRISYENYYPKGLANARLMLIGISGRTVFDLRTEETSILND